MGLIANLILAVIFLAFSYFLPKIATLFLGLAILFVIGAILFLVLAFLNPQTVIGISDDFIFKRGLFGSQTIKFKDVVSAILAPDPEAQNYLRLDINTGKGDWICIDPRFISSQQCDMVSIVSERLQAHGKSLDIKQ